jgi:hypothetical protein
MAIFRNEGHVLREWVEHYRSIGVDHFYLIDNNSTDKYDNEITEYIEDGTIDLFKCHIDGYQIGAYTEMLPILRSETEWVGVFDLDEFAYPRHGEPLQDLLSEYERHEAVLIPWLSFGSNGHQHQPRSVIEGFVRRGEANVSRSFLKAISRPRQIESMSQHNPRTSRGEKVLSNGRAIDDSLFIALGEEEVDQFRIINNHYRLQSRRYFRDVKTARPEVHEDVRDRAKSMAFFDQYDELWCRIEDRRLVELRDALRKPPGSSQAFTGDQLAKPQPDPRLGGGGGVAEGAFRGRDSL